MIKFHRLPKHVQDCETPVILLSCVKTFMRNEECGCENKFDAK